MTPPLRENPASVLDPHAPQSVPENPQVFDDVIEQRVLRSLIHDLRSPMAVLGAFFDSDSRSDSQDIRDRARAAFEQSNRLLEEFIETVQTGLFEQPPLLEETNVAAFLVDVARLYSVAMRNALPAITLKIRSPKLRAVVDTRKLRRVLNNLINNAIRHSGATRLVLGARVIQGKLVIVVSDNGCGLSAEQGSLLGMLARGGPDCEMSMLTETDGTPGGLGFLIAYRYAREMGGRLEHVARTRTGAHFRIWTAMEAKRERQRVNQSALRSGGPNRVPLIGRSIAILERDARYRGELERIFGDLGANVFVVSDPVQMLAQVGTELERPDLLLLDLERGADNQANNIRLLRQLQVKYENREFPLVAMTDDPWDIAHRDFNSYAMVLEKPISREWIDAIVRAMTARQDAAFRLRLEREGMTARRWKTLPPRSPAIGDAQPSPAGIPPNTTV